MLYGSAVIQAGHRVSSRVCFLYPLVLEILANFPLSVVMHWYVLVVFRHSGFIVKLLATILDFYVRCQFLVSFN